MSIIGTNTLLLGDTGTGKTYCIRTFLDAGVTPFILATEPDIASTLGDVPKDKLHWHYIPPANIGWQELIDSADKINRFDQKGLASLVDVNKRKFRQWMEVLAQCNNFTCQRCGESFGDVSSWGPDRAFIVDSLSGLNIMAMNLVVGSKPIKSQGDWGIAMSNLEFVLTKMTTDTRCFFVLTAHLERQIDEITGGITLAASVLGNKLTPKVPRFFSDVILCKRAGTNFFWSTADSGVSLKARNLPLSDKLDPSFKAIVERVKEQG